jgi:hypothetical protein
MRTRCARAGAAAIIAAAALPLAPPASAEPRGYYWEWDDGSRASSRTFTQARYGVAGNLPRLVVTSLPALPPTTVVLEFLSDGQWRTENRVRTGPSGIAEIAIDPSCGDERWCDETISYRLRAGGQTARLTVTYQSG